MSLEALQGSRTSFLPQIHALRPLRGQQASAANVLRLLEGSAINEAHRWCDKVQDAYSLRCAPQVHGASRDLLDYVEYTVAVELNAATDNPLVLVEDGCSSRTGTSTESRSRSRSTLWPSPSPSWRRSPSAASSGSSTRACPTACRAFLTTDGGLNSGFMIPQYVAASLVSENKVLAHPASVDSIPTSAGQEDHVSMGNAAGLKAWQVLANAESVLAIELLAGAQAVEFLAPLEPGSGRRRGEERGERAVADGSSTTARCRPRSSRRDSDSRRLARRRGRSRGRRARVTTSARRTRSSRRSAAT